MRGKNVISDHAKRASLFDGAMHEPFQFGCVHRIGRVNACVYGVGSM
jgi:hypothetical protein